MDFHSAFPGLGAQLSSIIKSLNVHDSPSVSLKCKSGAIHLDIVWKTKQQVEPTKRDLETTGQAGRACKTNPPVQPASRKSTKRKSPSTVRRDKRRLASWLARKSGESMECSSPITNLEADIPEVAPKRPKIDDESSDRDIHSDSSISSPDYHATDKSSSDIDSDSDADLSPSYLRERPLNTCNYCSSTVRKYKICYRCFFAVVCGQEKCRKHHELICKAK